MFFTNGGALGGSPVWLLPGTVYIALILDGKLKFFMLVIHTVIMIVCWTVGYYHPEFIVEYSREGNFHDAFAGLFIVSAIVYILITFQNNLYRNEEEQKNLHRLFSRGPRHWSMRSTPRTGIPMVIPRVWPSIPERSHKRRA
ncbi:MAG: hypothetical protein K5696_04955 [Lachnospiraceae bacterium]|nr:hypothetical protein [Lachnospiraceae bacterium]